MFTAVVIVCTMSATGTFPDCTIENATQVAIMQKEFRTRSICQKMGHKYGPEILDYAITPIQDRMKVLCVKSLLPVTTKRRPGFMPPSVRRALRR